MVSITKRSAELVLILSNQLHSKVKIGNINLTTFDLEKVVNILVPLQSCLSVSLYRLFLVETSEITG